MTDIASKPTLLANGVPAVAARYLQVSAMHAVWYAQYGNPEGLPVIVLHGGPGAGCDDETVKLFDLKFWRVILLDQRAAKRSTPFAEMAENTTQHLIADIEQLRAALHIDQWLLFGGSWGSALALAYAQTYPQRVLGFILRGIFLARAHETQHLWFGMGKIFPEAWQELNAHIPMAERDDLIQAYYRRVMSTDLQIATLAARAFVKYDYLCSYLNLSAKKLQQAIADDSANLGLARTFIHYCVHYFFLQENQLIDNIGKINHLPLVMVHGRYDIITLPQSAFDLQQVWPGSQLVFVDRAGHSAKEKPIVAQLSKATENMKNFLND